MESLKDKEKDYYIDLIVASLFKRLRKESYSKGINEGFKYAAVAGMLEGEGRFKEVLEVSEEKTVQCGVVEK